MRNARLLQRLRRLQLPGGEGALAHAGPNNPRLPDLQTKHQSIKDQNLLCSILYRVATSRKASVSVKQKFEDANPCEMKHKEICQHDTHASSYKRPVTQALDRKPSSLGLWVSHCHARSIQMPTSRRLRSRVKSAQNLLCLQAMLHQVAHCKPGTPP